MFSRLGIVLVVGLALDLALGACIDTDSNTDLVTAGPPEIAQVRLNEAYSDTSGASEVRRVFAFGTQPTATADEEHPVTTAVATGQALRVISDQLLRGNRLEQIPCRDVVALDGNGDQTMFSDVPDDATPDDIAKCAVSNAALAQSCVGPMRDVHLPDPGRLQRRRVRRAGRRARQQLGWRRRQDAAQARS